MSRNFSICLSLFSTYENACTCYNIFLNTIAMLNTECLYQQLPDKKIFELVKHDDKKAFGEIYARYWDSLILSASKHLQSKQKGRRYCTGNFYKLV